MAGAGSSTGSPSEEEEEEERVGEAMEDSNAEAKGFTGVEYSVSDTMKRKIGSTTGCIHFHSVTFIVYNRLACAV